MKNTFRFSYVDTDADKKTYTPTVQKQVSLDTRGQLLALCIV